MTNALTVPVAPGEPQPADAELRLPRAPGVIRRWLAAHPRFVDWFIVGGYLFGCALVISVDVFSGIVIDSLDAADPAAAEYLQARSAYLQWPWLLLSLLLIAVTAIALRLRRRYPLAGLVVVCAVLFFEQGLLVGPNSVALVFLLYAVPVYRGVAAGWLGLGVALVTNLVLVQLTGGASTGLIGPAGIVIAEGPFGLAERVALHTANAVWLLAVLMVGINLGNRRRYVAALIDRAHQLAREREQRAQLAAAAERARIAREMHDVVAHSLSVVVTLSEAASVAADTQPEAAKRAMERAAETGRAALMEMRRLLGVLAEDGADGASSPVAALAPQPGLAQLSELVASFAEAGLSVAFAERGEPRGDAQQQLAVYRIVQEGLTNALRHAGPGARVELTIAHDTRASTVEVVDSGPAGGGPAGGAVARGIPGSGRGLDGLAERVRLFGGELERGPRGPGWRLFASVPVSPVPVSPAAGSEAGEATDAAAAAGRENDG